jgi:hypothetical protein
MPVLERPGMLTLDQMTDAPRSATIPKWEASVSHGEATAHTVQKFHHQISRLPLASICRNRAAGDLQESVFVLDSC